MESNMRTVIRTLKHVGVDKKGVSTIEYALLAVVAGAVVVAATPQAIQAMNDMWGDVTTEVGGMVADVGDAVPAAE